MTKVFLTLVLLALPAALQAQPEQEHSTATYSGARGRYRLAYPRSWQLRKDANGAEAVFSAPATGRPVPAVVVLTVQDATLDAMARPDSLWRSIQRLARPQVLRIEQREGGDVRYEYTYAPVTTVAARTRVLGRWVRRNGYDLRLEYRADLRQDGRFLAEGRQVVESLTVAPVRPAAPRRADDAPCDNKFYGIAATRRYRGHWEDDCRTIHEFSTTDPTDPPVVHRRVLPFQSYALAKGFDNCLYSVTKAPTDQPERVYRYDPATRRGAYTDWELPAQGPENIWISASTDEQGQLYFLTSDANQLVRVSPADGAVTPVWAADPIRTMPYYHAIAFAGAGTHGNFCLDESGTLYMVYSTDGALLRVDLRTGRANPDLLPIDGLPRRGGYSDVLIQNDAEGRRRLYLAGPKGIYKVDLARHWASRLRKGTYTDLAGCNLFRKPLTASPTSPARPPAPAPPPTATVRGRVLDSGTYRPLPQSTLRLGPPGAEQPLALSVQGTFAYAGAPAPALAYRVRCVGYLPVDSTYAAGPGALVHDILLRPLLDGATLRLDKVQFAQGQAVLLPSSFGDLNQLVSLMTDNPRMTIELRGHTDNVGAPEKNIALSEQRVATVKAYLVKYGIISKRITGVGLGGTQPNADNDQEATRRLNRRVEVRVTTVR